MSTARRELAAQRGLEQALLHVEVHTAPRFTTPYKPSVVTS